MNNGKIDKNIAIISKKAYLHLYIVAFGANLALFACNISLVWPSPTLVKLQEEDSYIQITDSEGAWLINTFVLGSLFSPLITALFMNRVQRKMALFVSWVPLVTGWLLIALTDVLYAIYVARVLLGLSFALFYTILPHYLAEISTDNARGGILATVVVMAKSGALFTYVIGPMFSVKTFAWIALIPAVIFAFTLIWLPESPYRLLGKQRKSLAAKHLKKLRRQSNVQNELEKIEKTIEMSQQQQGYYKEIFASKYRKCFVIILLSVLINQGCGSGVIFSYAETIFLEIGGNINSNDASIIFGVALLLFSIISLFVTDRFGRRKLVLTSLTGIVICHLAIGIYFLLIKHINGIEQFFWIPLIATIVFTFFFCLGIAVIPIAIVGELFPNHLKMIASIVSIVSGSIIGMLVIQCFQLITSHYGRDIAFFCLAILNAIIIPLGYFLLPETKGKSLMEIQEDINLKKSKSVTRF